MNFESNTNKSAQLPVKEQDEKSVLKLPLTATYEGNNEKGADIFAMKPYNMPCIVPDKTFKSNMPVAEAGKYDKDFVSPFKKFQENKEKNKHSFVSLQLTIKYSKTIGIILLKDFFVRNFFG